MGKASGLQNNVLIGLGQDGLFRLRSWGFAGGMGGSYDFHDGRS